MTAVQSIGLDHGNASDRSGRKITVVRASWKDAGRKIHEIDGPLR